VEDSLKCQIFGQFGENYSRFTKTYPQHNENYYKFLNYFSESEILEKEPVNKYMLYFNLPFESIIMGLK
jgi:hypothetical protein